MYNEAAAHVLLLYLPLVGLFTRFQQQLREPNARGALMGKHIIGVHPSRPRQAPPAQRESVGAELALSDGC